MPPAPNPDALPFRTYQALLIKWQKAINLIAKGTLNTVWERHILDSAQLFPFLDPQHPIGDMGSGAGFPGLVLALMGVHHVHLIESDTRKCLFLEEVIRATGACATVHPVRLEAYKGPSLSTWVSRAFAPIDRILTFSSAFLTPQTRFVLLKGETAAQEVENALKTWQFDVEIYPSLTHAKGQIVVLKEVSPR